MENFEKTVDDNLAAWVAYVQEHGLSASQSSNEFDMARSIQWLLFDMICGLCLGQPLGFVKDHADKYSFQKTLEDRLPVVEKFAVLTEVNWWIRNLSRVPLMRRLLPSSMDKDGIGAIVGVSAASLPLGVSDHSLCSVSREHPQQTG